MVRSCVWLLSMIPTPGRLRQEDCYKFKARKTVSKVGGGGAK